MDWLAMAEVAHAKLGTVGPAKHELATCGSTARHADAMTTVSFTPEQADRALALFAQIRSRPGMWIGRFDWFTAEAFWEGYLCALHDDGLSDFRTWGLAHLGTPETNVHPISQLRRLHGLPTDDATYPSFDRTRAEEIAALVFNLIEDYIRARVKP